jgi:hypothetical protein
MDIDSVEDFADIAEDFTTSFNAFYADADDIGFPAENIEFAAFGAGSVDPIPWQNRGTHNQVVEILGED